ncbi:glycosyltransferase family 4 protein [Confluentibacter flavum]|uniref:Glycosyltransferase family 1 protein n=1 Tax=Confluentibacter flavum TaxID=1909700 RepID=A0A2N3HFF2_9FLAO|nr:glycosyltransferase family 4 protein [Confluentibacter flavum]PKQ43706.1 hypothetical protein CSW08_17045 [Confluentibacter flavum]
MNIAIFSRILYLSGVTTHIIDLTMELIKKRHKVYIFTSGPEFPDKQINLDLQQNLERLGAVIVILPYPIIYENIFKVIRQYIISVIKTRKQILKYHIDVIHVHTPVLSFIPKILGFKFIKTTHQSNLKLLFFNQKANHEIALSQEIYSESVEKYNYTTDEISIVHNGVSQRFYELASLIEVNSLKHNFGVPKNKIVLGIVGTIQHRKGHDILLKAISLLDDVKKTNIHLIILGDASEEDETWLSELIHSYNLEGIVSRMAFQDPKPIYDMIDVFILPSRREAFPLCIIEAMLSGCCVIRSDVSGAAEQIENNITGFIFSNENHFELFTLLSNLIDSPGLIAKTANMGRDYARENFTSKAMAEKTLKIYNRYLLN